MKKLLTLVVACVLSISLRAETKADIFNPAVPITWLGLDFSQLVFIGSATQYHDAGTVTGDDLRNKYFPGWNELVINEKEKYNVADAVHRTEVTYATEVTAKANKQIPDHDFFSTNESDFQKLTEQKIGDLVKKYDFQGKTGIGLMFFVDGMNKSAAKASVWVTFVDMKTKKVLFTEHEVEKSGGFGFRNYWAKSFYNVLITIKSNFKSWQ